MRRKTAPRPLHGKPERGDGYFVEYASVGEIADAVVDLIVTEAGK